MLECWSAGVLEDSDQKNERQSQHFLAEPSARPATPDSVTPELLFLIPSGSESR